MTRSPKSPSRERRAKRDERKIRERKPEASTIEAIAAQIERGDNSAWFKHGPETLADLLDFCATNKRHLLARRVEHEGKDLIRHASKIGARYAAALYFAGYPFKAIDLLRLHHRLKETRRDEATLMFGYIINHDMKQVAPEFRDLYGQEDEPIGARVLWNALWIRDHIAFEVLMEKVIGQSSEDDQQLYAQHLAQRLLNRLRHRDENSDRREPYFPHARALLGLAWKRHTIEVKKMYAAVVLLSPDDYDEMSELSLPVLGKDVVEQLDPQRWDNLYAPRTPEDHLTWDSYFDFVFEDADDAEMKKEED